MRLTAIGAPVAVKSTAVEPVNKVKILPVQILLKIHLNPLFT
jgi:hypothetical protein